MISSNSLLSSRSSADSGSDWRPTRTASSYAVVSIRRHFNDTQEEVGEPEECTPGFPPLTRQFRCSFSRMFLCGSCASVLESRIFVAITLVCCEEEQY